MKRIVLVTGIVAVCLIIAFGGSGASASSALSTAIMYDFESINAWTTTTSGSGTLSKSLNTANRIEGQSAMKITYNFATSGDNWGYVKKDIAADTHLPGGVTVDSFSV